MKIHALSALGAPDWLLSKSANLALLVAGIICFALLVYRHSVLVSLRTKIAAKVDVSDESEVESDSSRSHGFVAGSKERQALRRMLGKTASKRSSIIRIVSTDPTSTLCENPIHIELDPTGRRPFWPVVPSTAAKEAIQPEKRSSSLSGSPAPSRRRKDIAIRTNNVTSAGRSISSSPSPLRSPLLGNAPPRPVRARSVDSTMINRSGSGSRSKKSIEAIDTEDDWIDNVPASEDVNTPDLACDTFAHAYSDDFDAFADSSPESSELSHHKLPSILKCQAQVFKTGSLRKIDNSHALMRQGESLAGIDAKNLFGTMPNPYIQPLSGGLTAPPPYSPAADRINDSWLQARKRKVKLVEPDWESHAETHVRAQERLEAASRFGFLARSNSVDQHLDGLAQSDYNTPNFWFERFTQSTAAAGRDWDWRKRRARLQRAAAIGAAMSQSAFGVPMSSHMFSDENLTEPLEEVNPPSRKLLPPAPLITFTEQELQSAPRLSIDTESARNPLSRTAAGFPISPTPSGSRTPMGGIFSATEPKAGESTRNGSVERRRRASEDVSRSTILSSAADLATTSSAASRPPLTSEGSSSSLLKGMKGALRRKTSATADSSESTDVVPTTVEDRMRESSSPLPSVRDARISSLGNIGRKISRNNARAAPKRSASASGTPQNASGIELISSSDNENVDVEDTSAFEQAAYERSLLRGQPLTASGFRSSADAYGSLASRPGHAGYTTSPVRQEHRGLPSAYFEMAKDTHAVSTKDTDITAKKSDILRSTEGTLSRRGGQSLELERDSIDLKATEPQLTASTLTNKATSSPPVVRKCRTKSGSRSSIMRSSNTARSEIDYTARMQALKTASNNSTPASSPSGSRTSSRRTSPSSSMRRRRSDAAIEPKHEPAPDPLLQPEPAPRGMAYRARSASISSNASSAASSSRRSSRSNSLRDGQSAPIGFSALAMTTSTPGSPQEDRKRDPFSIDAFAAQDAAIESEH